MPKDDPCSLTRTLEFYTFHVFSYRLAGQSSVTLFSFKIIRCSFLFFCLGFPRSDCVETQFCYRKTSTVKSISWCFEKSTQVNNNCPTVCIRLCSLCKWTTTLQHCRMSTWECVQEQQLFYVFSVRQQCPAVCAVGQCPTARFGVEHSKSYSWFRAVCDRGAVTW